MTIETAKIITLSTEHLHPKTIEILEATLPEPAWAHRKLPFSVAIRDEGFLVNTHLGCEVDDRAEMGEIWADEHPDLALARSLGRHLGAEWINFDRDGIAYPEYLPIYDIDGYCDFEKGCEGMRWLAAAYPGARIALAETGSGALMVQPSWEREIA